jgi:hypothetical protein
MLNQSRAGRFPGCTRVTSDSFGFSQGEMEMPLGRGGSPLGQSVNIPFDKLAGLGATVPRIENGDPDCLKIALRFNAEGCAHKMSLGENTEGGK